MDRPEIFDRCFFVVKWRSYASTDLKTNPHGSQVKMVWIYGQVLSSHVPLASTLGQLGVVMTRLGNREKLRERKKGGQTHKEGGCSLFYTSMWRLLVNEHEALSFRQDLRKMYVLYRKHL